MTSGLARVVVVVVVHLVVVVGDVVTLPGLLVGARVVVIGGPLDWTKS